MRRYLRFATVLLVSLLSLSQAATVVCEATCGHRRALQDTAHTSEPACHSTATPASDAPWISGIDYAACDHDLPSDVVVTAQWDSLQVRHAASAPRFGTATVRAGLQGLSPRYSQLPPLLQASAAIPLPLRI